MYASIEVPHDIASIVTATISFHLELPHDIIAFIELPHDIIAFKELPHDIASIEMPHDIIWLAAVNTTRTQYGLFIEQRNNVTQLTFLLYHFNNLWTTNVL